MRRGLLWVLGATVLASVAAVVIQRPVTAVVQAVESSRSVPGLGVLPGVGAALAARLPLPAALRRLDIEPAKRDPFADARVTTKRARRVPPPVAQVITAPAPPPSPPPMVWRYLGAMDAPDGKRLVMLGRPDDAQAVVVEPGTRLEGGYQVLTVGTDAILVVYPPLQHEVVITIPVAPSSDR